jgi:hypothetical protein
MTLAYEAILGGGGVVLGPMGQKHAAASLHGAAWGKNPIGAAKEIGGMP